MSIIPLPGDRWPLSYTPLFSLSALHPLRLPVSNHLPLYLHHSVYLSIISCSIPLSSIQPLCFILLFQPTCQFRIFLFTPDLCFPSCSPHPFRAIIISPDYLCFLCSALPLLPGAPLPLCCPSMLKFPSLVIAFCLVVEMLRRDPTPLNAIC